MKVLLIGSGGREHALAWRLAKSPSLHKLYAAPGNPGIAEEAVLVKLNVADHGTVASFCRETGIDLVIVGPEAPLVDGLGDYLRAEGLAVFGPDKAAAQLEGSKGFTKDLCRRANIPTAAYARHDSAKAAIGDLDRFDLPVVIKADGLAAGKGVVIAETRADAEAAIADMFDGQFGDAGTSIVLEQFLIGEEASFFAISDGRRVVSFGSAQDHKRVGDGDTGPNTGGMGAYSPAPIVTPEIHEQVLDRIVCPTVGAMAAADMPYIGVLYAGLMLTDEGPQLIEYNCRFGDPECQVLMTRFDGDLVDLLYKAATGKLDEAQPVRFLPEVALTVVMAANGYPGSPDKGGAITDIAEAEAAVPGVKVFQAGTTRADGQLVASGGRVLNVTARGASVAEARDKAYAAIGKIGFDTGFCRNDIGWREIAREQQKAGA